MAHAERVAVSLPRELVHMAEVVRARLGFNRSKFFQAALKAYLQEFPKEEDKKLAHLYEEIRQTDQKLMHHFEEHSHKRLPSYE